MNPTLVHARRSLQRNILAGIITIAPLFVTYLIFSFLLGILAKAGLPLLWLLGTIFPDSRFNEPWIQFVLAVLLTLIVLFLVGRVTSQVVGRRALALFEAALDRLPVVAKIYGSVRQLMDNMMAKKESNQRVVLVEFALPGHRCIGFLSRVMTDSVTGEEIAAVLLPNAINPTSAFLQLVPLSDVVETDMSMEQAMSMLLTGGAVGPETLKFSKSGTPPSAPDPSSRTITEVSRTTETVIFMQSQEDSSAGRNLPSAEPPFQPVTSAFPPTNRPPR